MATQASLPQPEYSRNMRLIGHSSQGGKPDGVQVMVHRGYAYVGHMVSQGVSIIDVRDAKNPRPAGFIAAPPNTWNVHLQVHDDLLLVINARDLFADASFAQEKVYYTRSVAQTVSTRQEGRSWSAGLRIFDISIPDESQGKFTTVAGLIIFNTGVMPNVGDRYIFGPYELEVIDKDGQRIDKIMVTRL